MNGGALQLALRDLRAHLGQPSAVAGLLAVAAILGLSGPFDTLAAMRLPERLLYWALVTGLTYAGGFLVSHLLRPRVRRWPTPARVLIRTVLVWAVVMIILIALAGLFGHWRATGGPIPGPSTMAMVFGVCLVIDILGEVLDTDAAPTGGPAPTTPPILQRLPPDLRGALVAIRSEDHYVHVVTTRGRQMVLMRLSDAIAETAPTPGLRVHRSHWVGMDQIRAARRLGDGAVLTLSDGSDVPVSRSAMAGLRAAGLLDRTGGA